MFRRSVLGSPFFLAAAQEPAVSDLFPTQEAALAREMVGASHANLPRVNALLARQPTLAKAAWDWGFGDWETALGAASHVGNRQIAELLLENGAQPTIFSAAMLGQVDVVKAFVQAVPGVERTTGPHGIPLLAHGKAGKSPAMISYLESLPGADQPPALMPLTVAQMESLAGDYRFGPRAQDVLKVQVTKGQLMLGRGAFDPRRLSHLADLAFFPAGAAGVRIRFDVAAKAVSVFDPDLVLRAKRLAE